MKTADEWAVIGWYGKPPMTTTDTANIIRRIQADAIRGAVEEIRNGDTYSGRCDDLIPAIKLAEALE